MVGGVCRHLLLWLLGDFSGKIPLILSLLSPPLPWWAEPPPGTGQQLSALSLFPMMHQLATPEDLVFYWHGSGRTGPALLKLIGRKSESR